jgi:hypothetical protein
MAAIERGREEHKNKFKKLEEDRETRKRNQKLESRG